MMMAETFFMVASLIRAGEVASIGSPRLQDEGGVGPAESETVAHGCRIGCLSGLMRDAIEVAGRIRVVRVDGGRNRPMPDRQGTPGRRHTPGGADEMAMMPAAMLPIIVGTKKELARWGPRREAMRQLVFDLFGAADSLTRMMGRVSGG
ncbi:MAG: hypothetical protein V2L15_04340 [Desulfobacteraceae bacterium]|jgi:hypothetical protein|nr:hypothetical protein [Desulfobacteraceae bacterium]